MAERLPPEHEATVVELARRIVEDGVEEGHGPRYATCVEQVEMARLVGIYRSRSAALEAELVAAREALIALNTLRSNVVATQSASWSNLAYPLVAILNAAGMEQFDPSEDQIRHHLDCYGGAGGYPGHELREPPSEWCEPVGRLQLVVEAARSFLEDPNDKNRGVLEAASQCVSATRTRKRG